jgi:hypothetical protein
VSSEETAERLQPLRERLEQALGARLNDNNLFFSKRLRIAARDAANWDRMADWLHEGADRYTTVLKQLTGS